MIEQLCLFLLRRTARRWPRGDEMLAEWRAELSTMDSTPGRLRYTLSLAVSRPHRTSTISLRRSLPDVAKSFLLVLTLPVVLFFLAIHFWSTFSSDTVVAQSGLAVAVGVGAVILGIVWARLTAGMTNVIRPSLLSTWVFGVPYLLYMAWFGLAGTMDRTALLDASAWLAGGIVCGIVTVSLTLRGHRKMSWVAVGIATLVVYLLALGHSFGYLMDVAMGRYGMDHALWDILIYATQPFLHVTLFNLVYTRALAARHAAA